jgi:hypothetical protein
MATRRPARLRAVIAVADRAVRPLRRIQRQFRQSVVEPAALAKARFGALGRDVGLVQVARSVSVVAQRTQGLARAALRAAGAVGLIGGGASVAGLAALTHGHAAASAEIRDTSTRLGVMADQLVGMRYAAEQAGAGAQTMDMAVQRLNRRLQDASTGKNKEVAALFRRLGIEIHDANGRVRSAADVMPELAAAFAQNENAALRTKMAFTLFDSEGVRLIPTLAQGRVEFERMTAEGQRLSGMTDELAERGGELADRLTRLAWSARGLSNVVADRLLPVLGPLLDRMSEWTVANREVIASRVAGAVERVAAAVEKVDFAKIVGGAEAAFGVLGNLVDMVGGAENALLGLAALAFAPAIAQVGTFAISVLGLAGNLTRLTLSTLTVARTLVAMTGGVRLLAGALGLVRTAFTTLVAFFAATPFGIAMAAVTALAGGVYLIYRN